MEKITESEDIPDDFLDPITGQIMKDPVRLPISGKIVNRITIIKHLLNDTTDPFNRQPLTKEEVIEMPELKQQVKEFLAKL